MVFQAPSESPEGKVMLIFLGGLLPKKGAPPPASHPWAVQLPVSLYPITPLPRRKTAHKSTEGVAVATLLSLALKCLCPTQALRTSAKKMIFFPVARQHL